MQNRIEELEHIKNNLSSPNDVNLSTANRRKSLVLLHNAQRRISVPRSTTFYRTVPTITDTETSSSDTDNPTSFSFDQRSIDDADEDNPDDMNIRSPPDPVTPISSSQKSQPTLDRSRLTIHLPFSHANIPEKPSYPKNNSIQSMSCANSIEDIAQIDTEVNLTLLLRENQDQISPLLYSKAVLSRTTEFRSSKKKDSSISQHETSVNKKLVI
jgi:hypothetical protein